MISDLKEMVYYCKNKYGQRDAFRVKNADGGISAKSFEALYEDVQALGTALCSLGLEGAHIAIIGENSYEWVVSYLAVVNGVGVIVPIDKELPESEIANIIVQSDSSAVIYSGTYADIIRNIQPGIPGLDRCIGLNAQTENDVYVGYSDLIEKGKALTMKGDQSFLDKAIDPGKMCVILFTSGTTGSSKGVMLCHKNLVSVIRSAMQMIRVERITLSVLPIHHTYENTCGILTAIYAGVTICINDSLKYVTENIQLFRPYMLILVPLFVEAMYKKIWDKARKTGRAKLLRKLIAISDTMLKFHIDLRRLFFHSIRKAFGGRLKLIICGGAPLRAELVRCFNSLGIRILNGYGITECSPLVSVNRNRYFCADSVGVVIPCCAVKIDAPDANGEGEILVRGDNVMLGYYRNPQATTEAFSGEWFKTGDIGSMDAQGFLHITGRMKNTIILSNGKNVQPEELEEHLMSQLPYIKEIVVFGAEDDEGKDTSIGARAVLDAEYAAENQIDDLESLFIQDVHQINRRLPTFKQINRLIVQYEEFEKTTSKKIKRFKIVGKD